jgi:hypothetical protein
VLGNQFRVSYSPVSCPEFRETTTLQGCTVRPVVFCRFRLVDVPSVQQLTFLRSDRHLEGFCFSL